MKQSLLKLLVIAWVVIFSIGVAFACDENGGGGGGGDPPDSATITAGSANIFVGQSTVIHADCFSVNFLGSTNESASIYCPEAGGVLISFAGNNQGHAAWDYTFIPSAPGDYTFYACISVNPPTVMDSLAAITVHVTAPSNPTVSATAGSIYPGQTATVSWSAADVDGDFDHVEVYLSRAGSPYTDSLGSGGASGSMNWQSSTHFNSSNPATGSYYFIVRAVDSRGGSTDAHAAFDVINHAPATSISPSTTVVYPGQSATITATTNDVDGNLTSQTLDYLAPGASSWVTAASWSGGPAGSDTLTWTLPVSSAVGLWLIHASGGDGLTSSSSTVAITVSSGTTGPIGLKTYRPAQ